MTIKIVFVCILKQFGELLRFLVKNEGIFANHEDKKN